MCWYTRLYVATLSFCSHAQVEDPEFGYLEPANLTPGKISLRLALTMITEHKNDSQENSAPVLAEKYNLDVETTYHVLEYFQHYNLRLPSAEMVLKDAHPWMKNKKLSGVQQQLDAAQNLLDSGGQGQKKS